MDHFNASHPEQEHSKILLLVRHAKSSWDAGVASDFERTLNERGKKDAPEMALRVRKRNLPIDAFVSSPARRAKKTAEAFAAAFDLLPGDIRFIPELYHANTTHFFDVITQLNNKLNTVAIFSHNPGITTFINLMIPDFQIGNMPTCGVFAFQIHSLSWSDFTTAEKKLLFFDYPKLSD